MKAILVVDIMPKNNAELFQKVFGIYSEEFWSYNEKQMLEFINKEVALRPMPEKDLLSSPFSDDGGGAYASGRQDGWNACIDEILGETE